MTNEKTYRLELNAGFEPGVGRPRKLEIEATGEVSARQKARVVELSHGDIGSNRWISSASATCEELERPAPVEYHCDHCGEVLGEACAKIAGFEGKRFCSSACAHDYRTLDSSDRLAEIEERLAARTPGEWRWDEHDEQLCSGQPDGQFSILSSPDDPPLYEDATLIAHAPDDLEWAVAEIKHLKTCYEGTIGIVMDADKERLRLLARNAELLELSHAKSRLNEELATTLAGLFRGDESDNDHDKMRDGTPIYCLSCNASIKECNCGDWKDSREPKLEGPWRVTTDPNNPPAPIVDGEIYTDPAKISLLSNGYMRESEIE